MKHKAVTILAAILFGVAVGATALLAQKATTPNPAQAETPSPNPQPKPSAAVRSHRMMWFGGDEGSWLGVSVSDVSAEKAKELKLPGEYGVIVQEVHDGSPAAKAGLEKGDVILQFAGEKVRSAAELRRLVHETPAGRSVAMEISRNGATQKLEAKIAEAPQPKEFSFMNGPHVEIPDVHIPNFDFNVMFDGGPRLGISGDDLTSQLAEYFGVKQGKGVLIREVNDGSAAQKAGLKAGDVIVKVGDDAVASVGDLRKALSKNPTEKQQLTLTIVRDRKEQTVHVELEPAHPMMSPQEISELKGQFANPEQMRLMKDKLLAQVEELKKNSELMRLNQDKLRDEVQRSVEQYRKQMEQFRKNYGQEIEQYRRDIQKQVHEGLAKAI